MSESFLDLNLGLRAVRFTPGYHRTGFQPYREWREVEAKESGVSKVEEEFVGVYAMPKLSGREAARAI